MRITGGELRGRVLKAPPGLKVRPTSDKVREALFNILGDLAGAQVLDVCAGAGTLGIEALSRGAASACFVEQEASTARVLRANLESLGLMVRATVLTHPAHIALKRWGARPAVELAFVDPPYSIGVLQQVLQRLGEGGVLAPGAVVVGERDRDDPVEVRYGGLTLTDERRYGRTVLNFYSFEAGGEAPGASGEGPRPSSVEPSGG